MNTDFAFPTHQAVSLACFAVPQVSLRFPGPTLFLVARAPEYSLVAGNIVLKATFVLLGPPGHRSTCSLLGTSALGDFCVIRVYDQRPKHFLALLLTNGQAAGAPEHSLVAGNLGLKTSFVFLGPPEHRSTHSLLGTLALGDFCVIRVYDQRFMTKILAFKVSEFILLWLLSSGIPDLNMWRALVHRLAISDLIPSSSIRLTFTYSVDFHIHIRFTESPRASGVRVRQRRPNPEREFCACDTGFCEVEARRIVLTYREVL
ncbi:hypothetical protein B0H11DRAFT_1945582 [Mycena galericulata]|nr:hypothetical protein B0H11DRAFT_1945582 [Mycena galericulata]